ncbi:MAG: aldolase/citrate lyase family protein [Microbacterium enclense]
MNETVDVGAFCFSGSAALVQTLSRSGLAWLCLDAQHGRWDDASVLAALDHVGGGIPEDAARVFVRPRSAAPDLIGRALDAGAAGVIVPLIDSAEQARAVVEAARFPPLGRRSFGPIRSPFGEEDDLTAANDGVCVVVMIETAAALDDVEAIAAVPGVDMLFVGPFDLSLALGVSVDALLADHDHDGPLPRIARAARTADVRFGGFAGDAPRARQFIAHGADFVSIVSDLDAAVIGVDAVRAQVG